MGKYYNPVQDIESGRVGRRIVVYPQTYEAAAKELRDGESLFVLCDRLIFKLAPYIPNQDEWDEFYNQYRMGMLLCFQPYALSAEECEGL